MSGERDSQTAPHHLLKMTDPGTITLAVVVGSAIGGAASGAAKHLTETAISQGQRWLGTFLRDHNEKAIEKAKANSEHFLNALALKVAALEEQQQVDRAVIDRALEEPSFGALLHNALIGAAQTEETEKHELLARLVTARLTAKEESRLAVASRMAAEAISNCAVTQLHLLGLRASMDIGPVTPPQIPGDFEPPMRTAIVKGLALQWLEKRFSPYSSLDFRTIDILHLEAVSCVAVERLGLVDFNSLGFVARWKTPDWSLNKTELQSLGTCAHVLQAWDQGLKTVLLTSIGTLIGTLVSDRLCGAPDTVLEDWV